MLTACPELWRKLVDWTAAYPHAVMKHLRGRVGAGREHPLLAEVAGARHAPLAVAARISGILAEARRQALISDYVQMELDRNVQLLVDYCGACEGIQSTPLPFA